MTSRVVCDILTHQMMHAYINPGNQIFLSQVLTVKEIVEIDHGTTWQVHVPHATRRRFGIFTARDSEVVPGPVGVVKKALGSNDGLWEHHQLEFN